MLTGSAGLLEKQISDWVRQNVCVVNKEYGRCKKVVVRHLTIEKKPQSDVHSINISSDPAYEGTEIADKVIMEVCDAAQRDANDMKSGVQTYAIYAYYTKDANYVPRKVFRVAAEEEFDPEVGPSEPASEKGLLMQLMRHNEVNSKNSLVAMGYIIQTFQKEIESQRAENRQYRHQQIDMSLLVQETLDGAHKRRLEDKKSEMEMALMEGGFEHLKVILPLIANKLAGKEVLPPRMDKELYLFASFLETLEPEKQAALRDMLSPQQLTVLAELLGMYEERKRKLTGDSPTEEQAGQEKSASKTLGGQNPLLKLFEKRSVLLKADARLEINDEFTRKIEERAANIRKRLGTVSDIADREDDK